MNTYTKYTFLWILLITIFTTHQINARCTLTPSTVSFANGGGTVYLDINNDCIGQIFFSNVPSWLTIRQVTIDRIQVTCQPYSGSNRRSVLIDYSNNGSTSGLAVSQTGTPKTWYRDKDRDGYGDVNVTKISSTQPSGYILDKRDCNDENPNVHPFATELCDGVDNDCDGDIDENVVPDIPSPPSISYNCESVVLTMGTAPGGVSWFWQDSFEGTEIPIGNIKKSITLTSGNVYYLRARQHNTGCWSRARRINYTINDKPDIPQVPTIKENCNSTVLTRNEPPNGIVWYWHDSPDSEDTSNSSKSITKTSGNIYYLRAYNTTNKCWSVSRAINYRIVPPAEWYSDIDGDGFGNPNDSILSCDQPQGYVANADDVCPDVFGEFQGCIYSPENHILTRIFQEPMISSDQITSHEQVIESIVYFDGLGRPKQQIAIKASPSIKDIVTHIDYDNYGRQSKEYLPFERRNVPSAGYKIVDVNTDINSYYKNKYGDDFIGMVTGEVNAYSENVFEPSPLNRVKEQGAPGKSWKANLNSDKDHTIKYDWETNAANQIPYFTVTFTNNDTEKPELTKQGDYEANQLYVTITKDENWQPDQAFANDHTTKEYTDKQNRVVLKRTYNENIPYDTYYVYDDFDNLTYVLPPRVNTNDGVNQEELDELSYQYKYDYRNRLIEKKIPGKGWEFIVYNKLDQPIMTQDALLKAKSTWLYTKYDAFRRVAYTGKLTDVRDRETIQAEATAFTGKLWVEKGNEITLGSVAMNYNDGGFPKVATGETLSKLL